MHRAKKNAERFPTGNGTLIIAWTVYTLKFKGVLAHARRVICRTATPTTHCPPKDTPTTRIFRKALSSLCRRTPPTLCINLLRTSLGCILQTISTRNYEHSRRGLLQNKTQCPPTMDLTRRQHMSLFDAQCIHRVHRRSSKNLISDHHRRYAEKNAHRSNQRYHRRW